MRRSFSQHIIPKGHTHTFNDPHLSQLSWVLTIGDLSDSERGPELMSSDISADISITNATGQCVSGRLQWAVSVGGARERRGQIAYALAPYGSESVWSLRPDEVCRYGKDTIELDVEHLSLHLEADYSLVDLHGWTRRC